MKSDKMSAFVIMAFDPEFEAIYSDLICPSLEQVGYEVSRADSLMSQQNILKGIIRQIAASDLIVAELTALNPNVFYELGVAHALRKPTILLTQSLEDLPFDLRSYRVVPYSTRFDEIGKLSSSLATIAERAKSDSIPFGNPVIDFLPAPSDEVAGLGATQVLAGPEGTPAREEDEEKGVWDFLMEGESSMIKVTEVTIRMAEATQDIGQRMASRTEEVEEVKSSGAAGSAAKMYRLVEATAMEISSFADKIDVDIPELHNAWDAFSESVTGVLRTQSIRTSEDKVSANQFRDQLVTLSSQTSEGLSNTRAFRDSLAALRGISRSMNRSTRKAALAMDKLISEFEQSLSYTTKVIGIIDELLKDENEGHAA